MPYGIIYHVIHPKEPERVRYVGKTKAGIKTRENGHWSDTNRRRSNSRLQNWLVKYRADRGSIEFRPVIECDTPEELNAAEIREIARLRSIGQADLNITSGGDGGLGLPWSEESRSKLSKTLGGGGGMEGQGHLGTHRADSPGVSSGRYPEGTRGEVSAVRHIHDAEDPAERHLER